MKQSSFKKVKKRSIKARNILPYIYILPFFFAYILFTLYPTIYGMNISFHQWDGIGEKVFVGLDNYISALTNPFFYGPLKTSMFLMITAPITTAIALIIAVTLNNKAVKFSGFYKTVLFLPYITMPVAIALLFKFLLNDNGVINSILLNLGLVKEAISWLNDPKWVIFNLNLVIIWRYSGYHMIIYLGGLQSLDPVIYEAATIDGANSFQSFTRITLPLMIPFITFLSLTSITGSLGLFDEPMMLYGSSGGPGGAAQTMGMYIYNNIFTNSRWGYGTAVSGIVFLISIALSFIVYKIKERLER